MKTVSLDTGPESLPRFTTLLQSGFYVNASQGTALELLLNQLPGFSREYITGRIETIFLDGLPVDTLSQQLHGEELVIALSAAMPGLAGAIFRKGGAHASLRSKTTSQTRHVEKTAAIRIRIKLFNVIAAERGGQILSHGCEIRASHLLKFLNYRSTLLSEIEGFVIGGLPCDRQTFLSVLQQEEFIHLTIRELP